MYEATSFSLEPLFQTLRAVFVDFWR